MPFLPPVFMKRRSAGFTPYLYFTCPDLARRSSGVLCPSGGVAASTDRYRAALPLPLLPLPTFARRAWRAACPNPESSVVQVLCRMHVCRLSSSPPARLAPCVPVRTVCAPRVRAPLMFVPTPAPAPAPVHTCLLSQCVRTRIYMPCPYACPLPLLCGVLVACSMHLDIIWASALWPMGSGPGREE